ncbi:MAG: serine hydrolase domain-containing protein [Chloroflexota bacterium]|jgi:CubicO group peptidase (beta-lactamase class C family)|nr:serine hydrolase domain-containing protein [Chloroflexota bacterium]MDP6757381.1 serine hydrolase domain-containing protein [Chloroflexota bacterium]
MTRRYREPPTSPPGLDAAAGLLDEAVEQGDIPGAVARVELGGHTLLEHATGHAQTVPTARPATIDTIYDLASLTKVVVTATAIMILVDRDRLELDRPVIDVLPEFAPHGKDDVTVLHLLTHTSGLPARNRVSRTATDRATTVRLALGIFHSYLTGDRELYTDLGFLALGEIVARVAGVPLDEFARSEIFQPLGMTDTGYLPNTDRRARCAATEDNADRGGVIVGAVHDEKAHLMEGVAGHAGLFGTAADLARFGRMLLAGGSLDGNRTLSPESAATLLRNHTPHLRTARGLAWALRPSSGFQFDQLAGPRAAVHTGFTGTSIYLDPDEDLVIVLLTNRVHPRRDNTAYFGLRTRFHNLLNAIIRFPSAGYS